jgi:predicted MFS family arabinose efflux permease
VGAARFWAGVLFFVPSALAVSVWLAGEPTPLLTAVIVAGLLVFGALFALNSALHSYLILAFTSSERVTMDVGFYYMANAAGRLIGTVLSGLSYQAGGLALTLAVAAAMLLLSWLGIARLDRAGAR